MSNVKGQRSNVGSGQSLFEVMFAIAIAALIMVGVIALGSKTVSNSSFSRNQAIATNHNQEAIEWLRGERDENWDLFISQAASSANWCLKELSWSGSTSSGTCSASGFISGSNLFRREVNFTCFKSNPPPTAARGCSSTDVDTVRTTITTYWTDAQGEHKAESNTSLTDWRK